MQLTGATIFSSLSFEYNMEAYGAEIIQAGTTPEQVSLGRTKNGIFVLSMNATR